MKKRLISYALLSSPIIAVYGVTPLYIFEKINLYHSFMLCIGLSINVFIFWVINIALHLKISYNRKWLIYLLSYVVVLITFFPKMYFTPDLPFKNVIDQYIVYPFITTAAINALILIICNSAVLAEIKQKADIEIEQLKVEKLQSQKQILIQQLQPHFLFNSLSVLKSLITEDANSAQDYTIKLSDFLRYSVESHKEDIVSLNKELQFVADYIELQKVRFEESFVFDSQVDKTSARAFKIPVFALQTLIENVFKHNHLTEQQPIHIKITCQDQSLTVWNNKISNRLSEKTSTGLYNLNRRYGLIMEKSIQIKETSEYFSVTIPLLKA